MRSVLGRWTGRSGPYCSYSVARPAAPLHTVASCAKIAPIDALRLCGAGTVASEAKTLIISTTLFLTSASNSSQAERLPL